MNTDLKVALEMTMLSDRRPIISQDIC